MIVCLCLDPRIPALLEVDLLPSNDLQNNVSGHGTSHNHPVPVQFPVIVYCHGLGGMRCDNTSICCDFASHGYVVAAIEHRLALTHTSFSIVHNF